MSGLVKCGDDKIRTKHHSWAESIDNEPMFANIITLDPNLAVDVWHRLSINTTGIEFREIPVRLHRSLILALSKCGHKR